MAHGIEEIVELPDPVGRDDGIVDAARTGWRSARYAFPSGSIGIVYESRPNVTADAAALCLKSGNASVLKGGSEALETNAAIADLFLEGVTSAGLPAAAVQLIRTADRAATRAFLKQKDTVDVIVPRGGEGLLRAIRQESRDSGDPAPLGDLPGLRRSRRRPRDGRDDLR